MDDDLKHNLTAKETWLRGMFILLFAFFLVISRIVTGAVVVIQFLFTVFTGKTNANLRMLGASLSRYVYQCLLFVTYNSDTKPFPFEDWPASDILEGQKEPVEEKAAAKPKAKSRAKTKSSPKKKTVAKKKSVKQPEGDTGVDAEKTEPESDSKTEG